MIGVFLFIFLAPFVLQTLKTLSFVQFVQYKLYFKQISSILNLGVKNGMVSYRETTLKLFLFFIQVALSYNPLQVALSYNPLQVALSYNPLQL